MCEENKCAYSSIPLVHTVSMIIMVGLRVRVNVSRIASFVNAILNVH